MKNRIFIMYDTLKSLLFRLNPETAHHITLASLNAVHSLGLTKCIPKPAASACTLMGITFPNRIGLAAGLDKNGDYIDALAALGFGFVEVGTITPKPQAGNPLPRLFRYPEQEAIINRMGFNNKGSEYLLKRLQQTRFKGVLGVNIGKNRDTPIDNALEDYLHGFRTFAPFATYITINISSPNTESLRALQQAGMLKALLRNLKAEQALFAEQKRYVPIVVKIAPDLTPDDVEDIAAILLAEKVDGVIATNTTVSRDGLEHVPHINEKGGLSGQPLSVYSTAIIQQLSSLLKGQIPIIASGGIVSAEDAAEKVAAGASLIQLYTGLIYRGPKLIRECGKLFSA
jgi:dihydroorotate dehydrogenase